MPRRRARSAPQAAPRVVGYVRVSTDDQALGPEAQRAALARWCEAHGAELVAVFEDLGVSGGRGMDRHGLSLDLAQRPGLLAAVDALADLDAGVLLVAKRDRLFRDAVAAAMIERLAARSGARVTSADGAGDGDGPEALLMRRLIDAFAEYERALIRARTRSALAVKRARGEKTGGDVPFGYCLDDDGRTLRPDPAEARVVDLVRELRADGFTMRGIVARLNDDGVPARGARWHLRTVERLLHREAA